MLKEIKEFYERTKLKQVEWNIEGEAPITFVHVFTKSYPRLPSVQLPESTKEGNLERLCKLRESTREFSDEPLSLEEIAFLLKSCSVVDPNREPERRTYPSAGGRFPIEIYLVAYNVQGLDQGAYHYNMHEKKLEVLWKKDLSDRKKELVSTNLKNPAATIIMTSVISRSEIKYWYKAYPFSYIEAGHIGQNIALAAAEKGVGACSVSGFVDDAIREILDFTEGEIPVYTMSVGKKK